MFEPLNREYTSDEILGWENNTLAVSNAVEALKVHLRANRHVPALWRDVHARCRAERHHALMQWIEDRMPAGSGKRDRMPKALSPKHTMSIWILYQAAALDCPADPPFRGIQFV